MTGLGFAGGLYAAKKWQRKKYAVHIGEQIVNDVIEKSLPDNHYALLSNLTLPIEDENGNPGTSQVDHVLVCTRGVFVIETKFYTGAIVGLENSPQWNHYTRFDKHTFQNPLRQNFSHMVAIKSLTALPYSAMHNLVVFSGDAVFKSEMPSNVIQSPQLRHFIESTPDDKLDMDDVYRVSGMLQVHRLPESEETDKQHVDYLKSAHKKRAA